MKVDFKTAIIAILLVALGSVIGANNAEPSPEPQVGRYAYIDSNRGYLAYFDTATGAYYILTQSPPMVDESSLIYEWNLVDGVIKSKPTRLTPMSRY